MNMCNAMETLGNVLYRSSLWIKLARSDSDEQPLNLAKWRNCIISSDPLQICAACFRHFFNLVILQFAELGYHLKHIFRIAFFQC